jgi:hypothetical protein
VRFFFSFSQKEKKNRIAFTTMMTIAEKAHFKKIKLINVGKT